MPLQRTAALAADRICAALVACDREGRLGRSAAARPDSASGEVAQYSLMKNDIAWLTDSNIVALASQVNDAAQDTARLRLRAGETRRSTPCRRTSFATTLA